MNLLSRNYDYLSQSDSNQYRLMAALADFAALMPRRWQLRLGQQAVSVYVVGKVSPTNLSFGPGYAYGSSNQVACPHLLDSQDVFNSAASFRRLMISFYLRLSQLLIAAAFSLNVAAVTIFLKSLSVFRRPISRVSPHILAAVVFIKQFFKDIAVMNRSRRYFIAANKFVLNINVNMILIAEMIYAILLHPVWCYAALEPLQCWHQRFVLSWQKNRLDAEIRQTA